MNKATAYSKFMRHVRIDLDMSMKDMANALGCSDSYLSIAERGNKAVSASHLSNIINFCNDKNLTLDKNVLTDFAKHSIELLIIDSATKKIQRFRSDFEKAVNTELNWSDDEIEQLAITLKSALQR